MQESQSIGHLFNGAISYQNEDDVSKFIDLMKQEQAIYVITQAINAAYQKGVFDLREAEIVSKSLRLLTMNKDSQESV